MSTTLNCLPWMTNGYDQNPCAVAQGVGGLCSAEYTVSLNNFNESTYVPNATSTNDCTCSWSIYNLLSACSACFEENPFISWESWTTNCEGYASSTSYLPSGFNFSEGIPYWAAHKPSDWENGVFNLVEAANIGEEHLPDVTGEPLPTSTSSSTTTTSSASGSRVPVGAIVGGVMGAIAILTIGGLVILWARRRHPTTAICVSSIIGSDPGTVPAPSSHRRTTMSTTQPSVLGYTSFSLAPTSPRVMSPVRSMTSLSLTSSLASPVSSGFSSNGHNMAPITDAADVISPFLAMSPSRPTTAPTVRIDNAAEARAEHAASLQGGQRARLNPPSYSELSDVGATPGQTIAATIMGIRRASTRRYKKRKGSDSGMTACSGHSRTSTGESASAIHTGSHTEQSRPRRGTVESASAGGTSGERSAGNAETMQGGRPSHRPPAI